MTRLLLFVLAMYFIQFTQAQEPPPKRELRAAWIASFTGTLDWPNKNQTPQQQRNAFVTIMNHHAQTGINAVYVQMRSQCDALYPSSIEPWSADLTGVQGKAPNPIWDPMQFAIDECRKRGIEFHAWLNPYRAVSSTTNLPGFSASHVAKQHPEWTLTVGTTMILNPGLPVVRDYITGVVVDILTRYDVDGIHFDDYFYPSGTINDDAAYFADPRGFTNRGDWRRDNVNLLIKRVYDSVKSIKPWVKFGVSPTGIYRNSTNPDIGTPTSGLEHYTTLYADSKKWLQQGWVDYLAPQVYWYIGQPGANYSLIVPWWNNNAYGRHIYIGMAGYKVNDPLYGSNWAIASQIPNEMRLNRSYPNIYGQSIYSTNSLRSTTKLGFRDSLRLFFYQKPALLPTMPWRDNTPPLPASALNATKYGSDSVVLNWTKPAPASNELDKVKRFVVYRSNNPAVDISDANNIMIITIKDTTAFTDTTIAPNTSYYYTVTALDRYQNESGISNVVADVPPSIVCPANQLLTLGASCSAVLPDYRSMATVNNASSVTQTPAAGTVVSGTGVTTITLTAANVVGQTASCTFTVTRQDLTAPVISNVTADPAILWAPNHKMRDVTIDYTAADNCSAVINSVSVSSNESQNGSPDWLVIDNHHLKLKAERNGFGSGRVYTITITSTDASGNSSTATVLVTVPHDHSDITIAKAAESREQVPTLTVKASPNPAVDHFVLNTTSGSSQTLEIKVTDNLGRLIETRRGIASIGNFSLGSKYMPGIYYLEIRQGFEKQTIKLVKLGK